MKKAFSMLELVFVLVVIGVISVAILSSSSSSSRLYDAATQLVSHIRYTQHLALVDDKFDPNDAIWFKKRWQIAFSNGNHTNNMWSYTIFSDTSGTSTGSPDPAEVAINPQNPAKRLSGGANGTDLIHTGDADATDSMNLGQTYGVSSVTFGANCSFSSSQKIAFDHLGRPLKGAFENYTSAYPSASRIMTATCQITLESSEGNIIVNIEPQTGYTYISAINI